MRHLSSSTTAATHASGKARLADAVARHAVDRTKVRAVKGAAMTDGLRERKMRASRRAMEAAAVEIATDEGVGAVTVDRVCALAHVSRSTFFNYFSSLEQAIFGSALDYVPARTEAILADHSDDPVLAASLIVIDAVRGERGDEVTRKRLALFAREPGTTSIVSWNSHTSRERLVAVIARWLAAHPELARMPEADPIDEARVTVALCITLSDEAMRALHEVDGEIALDLQAFHDARRRIAAIAAPSR